MAERKPVSKRMRFEVFKRDSFTCQYCGAMPPKVPLEIDHIQPVSRGGTNDKMNLVTACFDCNRGKSDVVLSSVPESMVTALERKKLAQEQYKAYKKILDKARAIMENDIDTVERVYSNAFDDWVFTNHFRESVKRFIENLGVEQVERAMSLACSKVHYDEQKVLKYFCGICWTWIKERQ